jgi:hypothetical protein
LNQVAPSTVTDSFTAPARAALMPVQT